MALLELHDVSVHFGGVRAVDAVSLAVDAGRVAGLIGPNGAGKTTTFNVITGLQEPTGGRVVLDGRDVTGRSPHERARQGMARTFQRLEVFGSLTVRDNVRVAAEIRRSWGHDGDERTTPAEEADRILARIGISRFAEVPADAVPTGIARLTELGRALAVRPRVLLLDEPSAGLNEEETEEFGGLLRDLAADGVAVLLVEHDVDLVMSTCAWIDVLDFGRLIASGSPAEVQADPRVRAAYLGGAVEEEVPA